MNEKDDNSSDDYEESGAWSDEMESEQDDDWTICLSIWSFITVNFLGVVSIECAAINYSITCTASH